MGMTNSDSWQAEVGKTIDTLASRLLDEARDVQVGQDLNNPPEGLKTQKTGIVAGDIPSPPNPILWGDDSAHDDHERLGP